MCASGLARTTRIDRDAAPVTGLERRLGESLVAVGLGTALAVVGHLPKNLIFAANLHFWPALPWLIVPTGLYLWAYWRYVGGAWEPRSTASFRRDALRARPLPPRIWVFALAAGVIGIVALVLVLRVVNQMVALPEQKFFDVADLPTVTIVAIIVVGAIVAAVVEEAAFRGYMQGLIEPQLGVGAAILISGLMFAAVHLGLSLVLVPYYLAVAALYGVIAFATQSILPTIVLHCGANIYSSTYLWLTGHAEWQAGAAPAPLIWTAGTDRPFWLSVTLAVAALLAMLWAYALLLKECRPIVRAPL